MKIAIVQIYDDKIKKYAEYSRLINSVYAIGHGYSYLCWEEDLVPPNISVYYNKLQAIYNAMFSELKPDWILYLDADAIVTNFSILIEDIIARHETHEVIYGTDLNGTNSGVILIKNTKLMQEYLKDCYSDRRCYHLTLPEQTALFTNGNKEKYKQAVGFETMHFFNAYIGKYKDMQHDERLWDRESFILHLQRLPDEDRIQFFKRQLAKMKIYCL